MLLVLIWYMSCFLVNLKLANETLLLSEVNPPTDVNVDICCVIIANGIIKHWLNVGYPGYAWYWFLLVCFDSLILVHLSLLKSRHLLFCLSQYYVFPCELQSSKKWWLTYEPWVVTVESLLSSLQVLTSRLTQVASHLVSDSTEASAVSVGLFLQW